MKGKEHSNVTETEQVGGAGFGEASHFSLTNPGGAGVPQWGADETLAAWDSLGKGAGCLNKVKRTQ